MCSFILTTTYLAIATSEENRRIPLIFFNYFLNHTLSQQYHFILHPFYVKLNITLLKMCQTAGYECTISPTW